MLALQRVGLVFVRNIIVPPVLGSSESVLNGAGARFCAGWQRAVASHFQGGLEGTLLDRFRW